MAKKAKGGLILDIVKMVFDIMQTVSFMMFIEEEGIQIRGFGIMSLMREGLSEEVATQVDALEVQVNNLETFCDSWGWIAPYVHNTYSGYVQAARDQIDAWRAWVTAVQAKEPPFGIRIHSAPTDARIYIDGKITPYLTPHTFLDLEPGWKQFKLWYLSKRQGVITFTEDVKIEKGVIKEFKWILEP